MNDHPTICPLCGEDCEPSEAMGGIYRCPDPECGWYEDWAADVPEQEAK